MGYIYFFFSPYKHELAINDMDLPVLPKTKFVNATAVAKLLGVSIQTVRNWATAGKISYHRLPDSGARRYSVQDAINILNSAKQAGGDVDDKKVFYCRVSTPTQKKFLDNQIQSARKSHPDYEIVSDVGSGLNFKRKGLRSLLERSMQGKLREVRISHKDRLCRIAFDLMQWIFEKNGCKVVVDNETDGSDRDEFCEDLLSVITVFAARSNGARSYIGKKRKEAENIRDDGTKRQKNTSGNTKDTSEGCST